MDRIFLKAKIKASGLTQKELAKLFNMSITSINNKLNYNAPFTTDELEKVFEVCNFSNRDILICFNREN